MSFGRPGWGRARWGRSELGRFPRGVDTVPGPQMIIPPDMLSFVTHYFEFGHGGWCTLGAGGGVASYTDPISGLVASAAGESSQPARDDTNGLQPDGIDDQLVLSEPITLTPPYSIFALVNRTDLLNTPIGIDTNDVSLYKAGTTVRHLGEDGLGSSVNSAVTGSLTLSVWKAEAATHAPASAALGHYQTTLIGFDTSGLPSIFKFQKIPASIAASQYSLIKIKRIIICGNTYFNQANTEALLAQMEAA